MKKILKLFVSLFALGLIGLIFLGGFLFYISNNLPDINSLADYEPAMNTKIFSRDGELLLEIGRETRDVVEFKDIPKQVVSAFLAAEDDNFYQHSGVDYVGIMRAFVVNLKAGRMIQGGSTITQQVAKSLLLSNEKTITRKIKDFLLAQKIEKKFSKEDILYLYLNQVYLGGGYYGVKSAVKGYFDKELGEATVAECALIAGLLVAPGRYSPYLNPHYAKIRQKYVLKRMFETQMITNEEYQAALDEEIKMRIRKPSELKGGHFTDWVRQNILAEVGKEDFLVNGYEITTTLDWSLQEVAEKAVLQRVKEVDKRQGYKGALGQVVPENHKDFILKQREEIYKEKSEYFTFTKEGENIFEYDIKETEYERIKEEESLRREMIAEEFRGKIPVGNAGDKFIDLIEVGKNYEAVVTAVDDSKRIAFAELAGLKIAISAKGYSWAHERVNDDEAHWFRPIEKASSVFKVNDKILVKVIDKSTSIWDLANLDYKKAQKNKKLVQELRKQKFIEATLDQKPEAEGAFVAISPYSGDILSMVGGIDFRHSQYNRAVQAQRQPGSSFKAFIYAAALEEGFAPTTILLDTPQALGGANQSLSWKPRNYDGKFKGRMTFRRALEISRNIPTIKILLDVGVDKIEELVKRFEIEAKLPKDMSISLGSFGISLQELVKGYAIFANGGKKIKLKSILSIKDREGNEVVFEEKKEVQEHEENIAKGEMLEEPPKDEEIVPEENEFTKNLSGSRVYDKRLAYIMTNLLKGVIANGTGRRASYLSPNIAGKTGTTSNYVDALFVGYSSSVVAGAWVGYDDNKTLGYAEGGSKTALPIWIDVMNVAIKKYGDNDFLQPEGIDQVLVSKKTGKPTTSSDPEALLEAIIYREEVEETKDQEDYIEEDPAGKVLEDDDYFSHQ